MRNKGKIEMYQDKTGEWRWRAKAPNGRIVATGHEGYKSKQACLKGTNAAEAVLRGVGELTEVSE